MADDQFGERTEQATPKRREEARKKGQVARSKDVPYAALLIAALILAASFKYGSANMKDMVRESLTAGFGRDLTAQEAGGMVFSLAWKFTLITGPVLFAMLSAAVISNVAMVGFHVSEEAMSPDMSRINPVSGFKRVVSLQSLMELLKSLLKVAVVGYSMYFVFVHMMPEFPALMEMGLDGVGEYWWRMSVKVLTYAAVTMSALAAVDYVHQRWAFERSIRMTKADLKEEYKTTEGDPLIKGRMRAMQRALARRRMMSDVPKADVVVTNPTHLAVALMYSQGMRAPKVVAKGAGAVAERIKEVAREAGVPIMEDKPLARVLFKKVEIGKEIPVDLYKAVAEVLAYIYRLGGKRPAKGGNG